MHQRFSGRMAMQPKAELHPRTKQAPSGRGRSRRPRRLRVSPARRLRVASRRSTAAFYLASTSSTAIPRSTATPPHRPPRQPRRRRNCWEAMYLRRSEATRRVRPVRRLLQEWRPVPRRRDPRARHGSSRRRAPLLAGPSRGPAMSNDGLRGVDSGRADWGPGGAALEPWSPLVEIGIFLEDDDVGACRHGRAGENAHRLARFRATPSKPWPAAVSPIERQCAPGAARSAARTA